MAFTPQAVTVIDAFTRADDTVYAGAGAAIWDTVNHSGAANSLVVSSNQVGSATGAASGMTLATLPADKEFSVDLPAVPGSGTLDIIWSIEDGGTGSWQGYFVEIEQGVGITLYKRESGSSTSLDSGAFTGGALSLAAGDKLDFYHFGGTIRVRHYTSGAWTETPILEVTGETTFTSLGPLGIIVNNGTWRLDNLLGNAAIEETEDPGGGDDGPDAGATLYVDASDLAASDGWTRAEAADTPAAPFLTPQAAALVAKSDASWDEGDTIQVQASGDANPGDPNDPNVYPRIHHLMIDGEGTDFLPFADNTGNPAITVVGLGGAKIAGFHGTLKNWVFEDFQVGYDRGSGFDNLTVGTLQGAADLTFNRVVFTGGGYYSVGAEGTMRWEDCEFYSPFSEFHGTGGRFLDGVGNWLRSVDVRDGTLHVAAYEFVGCHFEDIDGEDAIQASLGPVALGSSLLIDDCVFKDITQAETPNAPHTDCIQSLGGTAFTIRRSKFIGCSSPFIASDDPNGTIIIENNIVDGPGNGFHGQGCSLWKIRHNTIRTNGIGIAIGDRTPDVEQKMLIVNNLCSELNIAAGVIEDPTSVISNNLFYRQPGLDVGYGENLDGLPELGTSARLDADPDLPDPHPYELANSPAVSPGIGDGVALDGDLGGTVDGDTDLYGRAWASPPDVGALQSDPGTLVTPAARAPYVVDTLPLGNDADVNASATARLHPKPGETMDEATITTSSAYVTDVTGEPIPAVVTIAEADEDGYQLLTIDMKASLSPLEEGALYPLVLYTAHLTAAIEDTEGSAIVAISWEFRPAGPDGPAIYSPADEPGGSSFILAPDPRFPVGMDLSVWETTGDGRAKGPLVASSTVAADSRCTFTGLSTGTYYVAGPSLAGPFTFFRVY